MKRPLGATHSADARADVGGQAFLVDFSDCRGDDSIVVPTDVILQFLLEVTCPRCGRVFYVRAPLPEVVPRALAVA